MKPSTRAWTWSEIAQQLGAAEPNTLLRLEKREVQHPRDAGMRLSMGLPIGQNADYRMSYPHCGGLHVRDYGTYYTAHLDRANPHCDPIAHAVQDTPQIAGGVALGALLGLLLGNSREATLAGAALGGLLGLSATIAGTAPTNLTKRGR